MKIRAVIIELIWLAAIFVVVCVAMCLMSKVNNPAKITFDINLHDTYLVLGWQIVIIAPFLLIAVVVYFFRTCFYYFKRSLQNWILIVLNVLLLAQLASDIVMVNKFMSILLKPGQQGWTIYPPLSALPMARGEQNSEYLTYFLAAKIFLFALITFFAIMLLFISIMTARNRNVK